MARFNRRAGLRSLSRMYYYFVRRNDAGRFIVHAEDMPTAFLELHEAIHRQLELG